MRVHELTSVDGFIVFDIDHEVVTTSAGGTRVADDVTVDEAALLARAMTYKFAAFEARLGGAKAGIVPRLLDDHADTMRRYCDEIRPMVERREFLTGADLGTSNRDFDALDDDPSGVMASSVDGVPFEDLVTGHGVVAAARAWLGDLDGATIAIEGFGKVGSGVARAAVAAGATVVGVATLHGAIGVAEGFDLDDLLAARAASGDYFVRTLGLDVRPPQDVFRLPVDIVVPGARTGSLNADVAPRVRARVVAPAANVPYTAAGLDSLRSKGVACLPDFVCNGGAVLGFRSPRGLRPDEVLTRIGRLVSDAVRPAREARLDPFDAAVASAELFLSTWLPPEAMPDGPALAPEVT